MNRLVKQVGRLPLVGLIAISMLVSGMGLFVGQLHSREATQTSAQPKNQAILVANSTATKALSLHLKKIGAKMYGAYWCPHCKSQINLFGDAAFRNIDYVECDPRGENPRPKLCEAARIKGYPTWEVNGKLYEGTQSLEELAKASNYKGPKNF